MGKINFLSEELRNRIAAGEVIDRPYSVVKEVVENSIDAGATEIEIYIERGGKDLIRVIDNGCGIEQDDMRAAFFAHATSKIANLEDIDHIHTLGFRGEALATISSVAQVELISAVEGKEGNKVICDGEYIGKVAPCAARKGTEIIVKNIFFNTPVRFKFMRSDKKEESDITNLVTRFILGNPTIAFKYYVDGKINLQSYGGGLEEAIAQVYGAGVLPNCFKIKADRNDIVISGFIGNQNYFKSNKTYQSVFLNGRYVVNPIIANAITGAYAAYTMKRQFPFYVLFVQMSEDIVDVNVHPNKSDVRFVDNALIYGTVYKVISSILDGTAKAAEYVTDSSVVPEIKSTFGEQTSKNCVYAADFTKLEKVTDKNFDDVEGIEKYKKKPKVEPKFDPNSVYEDYEPPKFDEPPKKVEPLSKEQMPVPPAVKQTTESVFTVCNGDFAPKYSKDFEALTERVRAIPQKILFKACKYRGSLFNTYLIYELENDVYFIDQHAAHERLLYDGLMTALRERKLNKQGMLCPYTFSVNAQEFEFLEKNIDTIWRMGFSIEPFGASSFKVYEVPSDLPNLNIKEFFQDFLSNIGEMKDIKIEDMLKEKIAQTACKHAVKGGEVLTDAERDKLFEMIGGDLGLKCPHGRPICVKMTKTEIEKMFKRKV